MQGADTVRWMHRSLNSFFRSLLVSCHESRGFVGWTADCVIPTEVEGSRAVYGAQAQASRLAGLPRMCRDPSMRPEDGARSLDYARDDGHIWSTFVQRGGS